MYAKQRAKAEQSKGEATTKEKRPEARELPSSRLGAGLGCGDSVSSSVVQYGGR